MSQRIISGNCAFCHGGFRDVPARSCGDHRPAYLIESSGATSLSNDHPISMTYPTNQPTQFNAVANGKVGNLPLYRGKVECASCHNVHNPANVPFFKNFQFSKRPLYHMSYKIIFSFQLNIMASQGLRHSVDIYNVPRGTFKTLDKLKGSFVEKLLNNHRDTEKNKIYPQITQIFTDFFEKLFLNLCHLRNLRI